MSPDGSLHPQLGFDPLSSTENARKYRNILSESVKKSLVMNGCSDQPTEGEEGYDTAVFPLLQMGQYGIHQDEEVSTRLLEGVKRGERLCLASGYFNLPPQYTRALLQAVGDISILAASPEVRYHSAYILILLAFFTGLWFFWSLRYSRSCASDVHAFC